MHGPGGKCLNFTPTFCDMIDYKVAAARLHAIDNTELAIEMNFYNQPGTWACRKEYKEFQCRIMFLTCTATMHVLPPCKKSCDEFALPGITTVLKTLILSQNSLKLSQFYELELTNDQCLSE